MNELTLSTALETALARIEDMLSDDDGQAFKEARKFLPVGRAALTAQPGSVGEWKRVPVEPTPAMLVAMWDHRESMRGQSENRIARAGYAAMLAAAPTEAKPAKDAVDAGMVKFARRWEMLAYMHTRGVPFSVYDHYIGNPERLDYAATLHREYLSGELERAAISAKKGGQP